MKTIKLVVKRTYNDSGQLLCESYRFNDKLHNPDGPALQRWNESGQVIRKEYRIDGNYHNPNGPAIQEWDYNGNLIFTSYWLNGNYLSREEFETRTQSCDGKVVEIDGKKYKLIEV